jgi:GntR family transcriptional repressor for pyruvate dehydrogenase complex
VAGNAVLRHIAYGLYNLGLEIRRRATADPAIIRQSTEDHTRIVEAIAAHNPVQAAEAMREHLAHIEESTRRFAALGHLSPTDPVA